jgi:transaldolase / glucose-6-phosphate isomerase
MSKIHELQELGQSIWYDNIRRALLDSGELQALLEAGVTGVTSNPSIFEKAIAGSGDYDQAIMELADAGHPEKEIYERLALEDIGRAADLLRPVYEASHGRDGYASLEVEPSLAHDPDGTVLEARRLFALLRRPNVMIKVPATPEGIVAVEELVAGGVNVNVTLIFSLTHYEAVAEAYLSGLERLVAGGGDPSRVASVASFFVSRVDTAVDDALAGRGGLDLAGTIAMANATVAYARYREVFSCPRWEALAAAGAQEQRVLWASTGTKNPWYPDTFYVDGLVAAGTVNTVPPGTLALFLDHGTPGPDLGQGMEPAKERLAALAGLGIDLEEITERLQAEGLESFEKAFHALLSSVAEKRHALAAGIRRMSVDLGPLSTGVAAALEELRDQAVLRRIWFHDHTVWSPEPGEIDNRLGWLHLPETMGDTLEDLRRFAEQVVSGGFTDVVLLGMGGSSLAPEVFQRVFGPPEGVRGGPLRLTVIDSTDPDMIRRRTEALDLDATLFIVSTKSGGTVETLSAFKHFFNQVAVRKGADGAGEHFVAITDPGGALDDLARKHGFRRIFLNDPNVGGRYAALSYVGLVPAVLLGVDPSLLLERAATAACNAAGANCPKAGDNDAARLGAILAEGVRGGRDKLTLSASPGIESLGDWIEQLVAESTGKDGTGILPVVGEPLGSPEVYGDDRLFVDLALAGDESREQALAALAGAGHPVVRMRLRDRYDLARQFFLWEMATAVAGARMGIHPFDQPNVEAAKNVARRMVAAFAESGALPEGDASPAAAETLEAFLAETVPGDYVALQAYVEPSRETDRALDALRLAIRRRFRVATTVGYGPRFLHSTGQLHKGDGGRGRFVQLVSRAGSDLPVPDEAGGDTSSLSFQVLKLAQALGDARALADAGRRLVRFDLGRDVVGGLERLQGAVR